MAATILQFKAPKRRKPYRARARPPKVNRTVRLDQEKLAALEDLAGKSGLTLAEYLRALSDLACKEFWVFPAEQTA